MYKSIFVYRSLAIAASMGAMMVLSTPVMGETTATGGKNMPRNLKCEVSCSQTKLRTGIATISWLNPVVSDEDSPSPSAGTATTESLTLDIAVHEKGFEEQVMKQVPLSPQPPSPSSQDGTDDKIPRHLRGAFDLNVSPSSEKTPSPASGAGGLGNGTSQEAPYLSTIENIKPGVNYFFRVQYKTKDGLQVSETVTCQAPVCPADMKEEIQP